MLAAAQLAKEYSTPRGPVAVLSGVDLTLERGQSASLMGPSGSGKSTLLYLLGALEAPTSGTVTLDGTDPYRLPEDELAVFRNRKIGFLFQDHCLLPQLTLLENVLAPTLVAPPGDHERRARLLLEQVGLTARLDHKPSELSGGEKQRGALARALIRDPLVVLCDEPTGNLDRESARAVAALLLEMHRRLNNILIVATHSVDLAARFSARYELVGRRLEPR